MFKNIKILLWVKRKVLNFKKSKVEAVLFEKNRVAIRVISGFSGLVDYKNYLLEKYEIKALKIQRENIAWYVWTIYELSPFK